MIFPAGMILGLPSPRLGLITISTLFFFTLVPFGAVMYLLQNGKIKNLDVPLRKNRNRLFGYSIISTTIGSTLIYLLSFSEYRFLSLTSAVFLINPIIAYFINKSYKISIHAAGVSTAGTLFMLLQVSIAGINSWSLCLSLFMLLVLLPLMVWSRYRLGIHSLPELIWGSTAGIFFTLLVASLMQIIR